MKRAEHEAADELAVFGYLLGGDIEGELLHPSQALAGDGDRAGEPGKSPTRGSAARAWAARCRAVRYVSRGTFVRRVERPH